MEGESLDAVDVTVFSSDERSLIGSGELFGVAGTGRSDFLMKPRNVLFGNSIVSEGVVTESIIKPRLLGRFKTSSALKKLANRNYARY